MNINNIIVNKYQASQVVDPESGVVFRVSEVPA